MLSWEGEEGPGSFCDYASRAVEKEFREHNVYVSTWLKADASSTHDDIARWLRIFKTRGRSECDAESIFLGLGIQEPEAWCVRCGLFLQTRPDTNVAQALHMETAMLGSGVIVRGPSRNFALHPHFLSDSLSQVGFLLWMLTCPCSASTYWVSGVMQCMCLC